MAQSDHEKRVLEEFDRFLLANADRLLDHPDSVEALKIAFLHGVRFGMDWTEETIGLAGESIRTELRQS